LDIREDQLDRLLSVSKSIQREEPDKIAERMEKLTDLLTELAKHVEGSKMTRKDKEKTKDLLNRIVLNIYEQKVEVKDGWASLEALE
jgi:septal ring factor EnvC (AmiA/AmiB activator)